MSGCLGCAQHLASQCAACPSACTAGKGTLLDSSLCCRYGAYLFFQLKTHGDFFSGEDNEEQPSLSLSGALALLTAITLVVAVASECAHCLCKQTRVLSCILA